jgi:hypothetical protein
VGKFETGQPKPKLSGRQKGSPNRRTVLLCEALDQLGQDLPSKIFELLPKLSANKQVDVYLELMQYVFPKRKAVEVSTPENSIGQQVVLYIPRNGREVKVID